jgi:hypothetical protein
MSLATESCAVCTKYLDGSCPGHLTEEQWLASGHPAIMTLGEVLESMIDTPSIKMVIVEIHQKEHGSPINVIKLWITMLWVRDPSPTPHIQTPDRC